MTQTNTIHHLSYNKFHNTFDNTHKPAITIVSGDTVVFECLEGTGGQITPDSTLEAVKKMDWSKIHHLTGPVAVEGAEPGDVIEVEFLQFKHEGWGWSCISPDVGLLPEDFKDVNYLHIWKVRKDGRAELKPGISVPIEPFPGIVGLAPAEAGAHNTMPPRRTGGNMDIRHLIKGSKIYLPVEVEGGLFSIGDCHLAQGDGEVCVTAIEAPMSVTVRFQLQKNRSMEEPQYQTPGPTTEKVSGKGYFATTSIGPDLFINSQNAVRYMINHLVNTYDLTREEAYILCSAAGDLQINEIVDAPNWVVSFQMPLTVFEE